MDLSKMPPFMPGLDLNRLYFQQVIRPLLDRHFPDLKYSAGILGEGSDVLRFDTPQSMDHNWGPHMRIFLTEEDFKHKKDAIDQMFRKELPLDFMGFPTNFTEPNEDAYLVQQMKPITKGPVNHMIQFYTVKSFFEHYLGFDPYKRPTRLDWLAFSQQALLDVTQGEVYYDGLNELEKLRQKFAYYPDDVWLYIYMKQWGYILNQESYMGRAGEVGDELGSNIIASNMVSQLMKLCFLIEKRYWPYPKWFGTSFTRLKSAAELTHIFIDIVHGNSWPEREEHLCRAYEIIAKKHNELKLTKPIETTPKEFEGRPYKTLSARALYKDLAHNVVDPWFINIKYQLGTLDQTMPNDKTNHMEYIYDDWKQLYKKRVKRK